MKGYIPLETTSFVGRERELAELETALSRRRLVSLTGVGGVGKTRLAQRAAGVAVGAKIGQARDIGGRAGSETAVGVSRFPDGVWWADLSTLESPRLLLPTISDAVDLADHSPQMPVEALCEWLADKRLLLVLDSCEHLVEECARLLGDLLTTVPGLTVLATSRRPLASWVEDIHEVAPLPADGAEALVLFSERVAARLGPTWTAEPGALEAAASICRRLEGIPLAIELAAAQVGPTAVGEVAAQLSSRFDILAHSGFVWPRRHQTMRTAIGWSHELCAPLERLLWARLSVFRGSFDLAAAQAVAVGGPLAAQELEPLLERLVTQSVVDKTTGDIGDRYRMLDTIRDYGHQWLQELGEVAEHTRKHGEYFTALARRADAGWPGSGQLLGYRMIEDAHPDLRSALDHWLVQDPAQAAELAALLVYFWTCCGHLKEARDYLDRALQAHTLPGPARTRALIGLGATVTLLGDHELAARISTEVQAAMDLAGDKEEHIGAACLTGLLNMLTGHPHEALDAVRAALNAAPGDAFDSSDRLRCHLIEVLSLTALGSFAEGRERAMELRGRCVQVGEVWTRSYLDYQLSLVALFSGSPAEAAAYARAMLESKQLLGDAFGIALGLDLLAAALAADGHPENAASVYGTSGAYWASVGHPQRGAPELQAMREQCERTARAALGDDSYTTAYARGATIHGPTAVATALRL
ncbi:ATP-binding protein [Actinacidiphila rubida]|uniref:Predicted ATPase n=1 Tax=Actinacidiphila rubida TaxID=310780 RepID=A0A1H8SJG1_9ACTN|nr:hypothetical protein [Actinacidiphila rubida]SEO79139.1 Predicted ATPase [Actinacidiphila rubida]